VPIKRSAGLEDLIQEIERFSQDCKRRELFNSRCDNFLNVIGIAISVAIVGCGVYNRSHEAALLGALVAAIVCAQRAFPFNQRWQFYRLLGSQSLNLLTETKAGVVELSEAIATLKAMRLDFAQQIPRGSSFKSDSEANTGHT
jgi:hypothetical protein